MSMESVLKELEARIEELVKAFEAERAKVGELEQECAELRDREQRAEDLEGERQQLAMRLEKVVELIDQALSGAADEDS